MYPSRFSYEAPHSIDEAIELLREHGDDAKPGRRPKPSAADEVALRGPRAARGHQQHSWPRLPRRRCRRYLPRRLALPSRRPRALDPSQEHAADDGGRRSSDRRPDGAQPGHSRRLPLSRRSPRGLGIGGYCTRRLRRRAGPAGAGTHRSPISWRGRSRTHSRSARWRSRLSSRRHKEPRQAGTSALSAEWGTLPPSAWR